LNPPVLIVNGKKCCELRGQSRNRFCAGVVENTKFLKQSWQIIRCEVGFGALIGGGGGFICFQS